MGFLKTLEHIMDGYDLPQTKMERLYLKELEDERQRFIEDYRAAFEKHGTPLPAPAIEPPLEIVAMRNPV